MSDLEFDPEDVVDPIELHVRARAAEAARRTALPSRRDCEECGEPIPEPRRRALPGVTFCVDCQAHADAQRRHVAGGWG